MLVFALVSVLLGGAPLHAKPVLQDIDSTGVHAKIRAGKTKITLVNVWATWCGPCVKEFPHLLKLRTDYRKRGVEVLLVSADLASERAAVEKFLQEQRVDFTTYMKAGDDMAFINGLDKRWSGALPATFIFDAQGGLLYFWEGEVELQEFDRKLEAALKTRR